MLPCKPLEVPSYTEVEIGGWKLLHKNQAPSKNILGYYGQSSWDGVNTVLFDSHGKVWMSTTPMELESQSLNAVAAQGHTVIAGLGMGVLLYNILKKPEVTKVTVLERDRNIYDIMHNATNWESWQGYEKLEVVICDALEAMHGGPVDYLVADIWQGLGEYGALTDTQKMCANLNPKSVMYWGQELDFLTWCSHKRLNPYSLSIKDWKDFVSSTGMPLSNAGVQDYHSWCLRAGVGLIAMHQSKDIPMI